MQSSFARNPYAPTLLDALIILFVSAGLVLFLFWLATRIGRFPVLETLPAYISDAFKSIWTSAISSTVGVGLAIYRALSNREAPRPNYLLWILVTTLVFTGLVLGLAQFLYQRGPITGILLPSDIRMLPLDPRSNRPGESEQQTFIIHNYSNMGVAFGLEGEYLVKANRIEGAVTKGTARLNSLTSSSSTPVRLAGIGISLCRVILDGSREQYDVLPAQPNGATFMPWEKTIVPASEYQLPQMKFRIDIPSTVSSDRWWLCAQLWATNGGNYPGYQSGQPLNPDVQTVNSKPPIAVEWVRANPLQEVKWFVQCPCASLTFGEPPGPVGTMLGDQAFIEVRNDCSVPVDVFGYKILSPELPAPEKLLTESEDKRFATVTIPSDRRARFSLAQGYGGNALVQTCTKK